MFYPDNDTGIDVMPEIAAKRSDTVKWFTKGGKGITPTVPGQDTWNIWQAELLNILNLADIKPDKTKLDQIAQAIKLIASAAVDNKIGDGDYLEVSKNLEEIYEHGLVAQAEARANIGIDGLIAYQDKANTFTKINTFKDVVCAYGGVNVGANGVIGWGGTSWNAPALITQAQSGVYKGLRFTIANGGVFRFRAADSAGHTNLNPLVVEYQEPGSSEVAEYNVYHEGNLDPVTSVNNIFPDDTGNIQLFKFNGDGAYSLASTSLKIEVVNGVRTIDPILFGGLLPGSALHPVALVISSGSTAGVSDGERRTGGGGLYGIWRACSAVPPPSYVQTPPSVSALLLFNRVSIGSISAFSNIRSPDNLVNTATTVDLTCDIAGVGTDLLFTASPDDSEEYGRKLYANAMAGAYGEVNEPRPGQSVN
ncbi:hypothetical protein E7V31_18825 [Salmonella enterica]|nr:hypothetical protein [Salmonella enterica]